VEGYGDAFQNSDSMGEREAWKEHGKGNKVYNGEDESQRTTSQLELPGVGGETCYWRKERVAERVGQVRKNGG